jgi:lysophospholipase L1-like esterase
LDAPGASDAASAEAGSDAAAEGGSNADAGAVMVSAVHALTTFTTTSADHAHAAGNSETAGGLGPGPSGGISVKWQAYLNAQIGAGVFTENGASGTQWSAFVLGYPASVLAYSPTLVFLEWGINDVIHGTDPALSASYLEQGVLGIWATNLSIRIVVLSVWALGEHWPDGAQGAQDAAIDALNAHLEAACDKLANLGTITWIDTRTPWLAALQAANPNNDSGYHLTVDHLHLNDAGAHIMSNIVAAHKERDGQLSPLAREPP